VHFGRELWVAGSFATDRLDVEEVTGVGRRVRERNDERGVRIRPRRGRYRIEAALVSEAQLEDPEKEAAKVAAVRTDPDG
jgi:hypothetical protein